MERAGRGMRAVLLERNKMVSRRLVRYFASAGMEAIPVEDPALIPQHVATADVIAADTFDGDLVAAQVRAKPTLRGLLWTAEPLKRSMRYLVENPQISNVLGRNDFESTPRPWELMMVLRRMLTPADGAPSMSAYLDWGYT